MVTAASLNFSCAFSEYLFIIDNSEGVFCRLFCSGLKGGLLPRVWWESSSIAHRSLKLHVGPTFRCSGSDCCCTFYFWGTAVISVDLVLKGIMHTAWWFLGCPLQDQELDTMILMHPLFQHILWLTYANLKFSFLWGFSLVIWLIKHKLYFFLLNFTSFKYCYVKNG